MNGKEEVGPLLGDPRNAVFPQANIYRSQVPGAQGYRGAARSQINKRFESIGFDASDSWTRGLLGCWCCLTTVLVIFLGILSWLFFFQVPFNIYSQILALVYVRSWPSFMPWLPTFILIKVAGCCILVAICGFLPLMDRDRKHRFGFIGFTCCCSSVALAFVVYGLILFTVGSPSAARAMNEICQAYSSSSGPGGCHIALRTTPIALRTTPGLTFTTLAARKGGYMLAVSSEKDIAVGDAVLIGHAVGGQGEPPQSVNSVTGLGPPLSFKDALPYDYPAKTPVRLTKTKPTNAPTTAAPVLPLSGNAPAFQSQLVGDRLDRATPTTPAPTAAPAGVTVASNAGQPFGVTVASNAGQPVMQPSIGAVLVDGNSQAVTDSTRRLRHLAGSPSDIDLDDELEDPEAFLADAVSFAARRLDAAHDAATSFLPAQGGQSTATCDTTRTMCEAVADDWSDETSCACNGNVVVVNGINVGGYCDVWDGGWGVEPWCVVNPNVTNCGMVERVSPGNPAYRSPGPCHSAVVAKPKMFVEGKSLYKVALVVGLLLAVFSCCTVCTGVGVLLFAKPQAPRGNARLVAPAMPGQNQLEVSDMFGFVPGQTVIIDEATPAEEINELEGVPGGALYLRRPCLVGHNIGARVATIPNQYVSAEVSPFIFQDTLNVSWSLEEQFRWAQKMASSALNDRTPEERKLELYGYFHQAAQGNVVEARPSLLHADEQHRWDAWNRLRGMPRNEAMRLYIDSVVTMIS